MKKFSTFQELWSYCRFCPLCQDITRGITVASGPGESSIVTKQKKVNEILQITTVKKVGSANYTHTYYIDCVRNTFTLSIKEAMPEDPPVKRQASNFMFFLISDCDVCHNTSTNSTDIELDILSKKVSNIGVELESIYMLNKKSKYHLVLNHEDQLLNISKVKYLAQIGEAEEGKVITFPLTQFDFSKPKKVFNRIRTLLVFS